MKRAIFLMMTVFFVQQSQAFWSADSCQGDAQSVAEADGATGPVQQSGPADLPQSINDGPGMICYSYRKGRLECSMCYTVSIGYLGQVCSRGAFGGFWSCHRPRGR